MNLEIGKKYHYCPWCAKGVEVELCEIYQTHGIIKLMVTGTKLCVSLSALVEITNNNSNEQTKKGS